jgi:hypothetical protein
MKKVTTLVLVLLSTFISAQTMLVTAYDTSGCGINYTQASVKLGQFPQIAGVAQPAPFAITGLNYCSQIDKAFLWCAGPGNGIPVSATITNPQGGTNSFPMTMIGQGMDMCWGAIGTYCYRADVTSIINGNGNYIISGLPTSTSAGSSANDMDGATLMIIYSDPTANYTGAIRIDDGAIIVNGGTASYNMNPFTQCANSAYGEAFMIAADLQMSATYAMNNNPTGTLNNFNWWNFISEPTSYLQTQTQCPFSVTAGGDCFCLEVAGAYRRTSCSTCVPASNSLNVTVSSVTPASCASNGSATINVTGGSGNYDVLWNTNPQQTSMTATNLQPGVYSVSVTDSVGGACGGTTVTIGYTGPVLSTSTTGVSCSSLGSATVNVTGGTGPYTYSWAPSGGNAATASNLAAGVYTVTVVDNTGCTVTASDTVVNNTTLLVSATALNDSCPSPSGAVFANVTGGQLPYTYQWLPGNQTTSSVNNLAPGTYTVNVTDGAGCSISAVATVGFSPQTISVSGNPVVSCGYTVQLFASSNYPNSTFSWSPSTYLSNPNVANPFCTPFGNITYTVTATSSCGAASDTFVLAVNGINTHNEQICMVSVDTALNKNVITWERLNSPPAGFYNIYRETSSAGVYALIATQPNAAFSTYTDPTANPLNYASRYKITTIDSCGVESDTSYHHRTLFLQVSPSIPSGFNLLWSAYEGWTISTYNIYRGPNASSLTLIGSVPGTIFNYTDPNPPSGLQYYLVEAVLPNGGCSPSRIDPNVFSISGSLSNLVPDQAVGVNENVSLVNSLLITPNPGHGNFQLSMELSSGENFEVMISDNLGRNVFSQSVKGTAGINTLQLDLSGWSSGVYLVNVKTENGFTTKKLVVE